MNRQSENRDRDELYQVTVLCEIFSDVYIYIQPSGLGSSTWHQQPDQVCLASAPPLSVVASLPLCDAIGG